MLEIKTFGGLSISVNGRCLGSLGLKKADALLIYLMLERRSHTRGELAALLWPESTQKHAATSLRVALSVLRKYVPDYLDIDRDSARIKPGASTRIDVSDLEQKLSEGDIEHALQLYQGDFLEGFQIQESIAFENWLQLQHQRLQLLVAAALHRSIPGRIEAGDYASGRKLIQRLLELDPLDEQAYYQSILLHGVLGERAAALKQFDQYSQILQEELRVEPPDELRDLHHRIQRGDSQSALLPALPEINLPIPQTSFIGRVNELEEIGTQLQDPDCRLLTLMGPGGSGKTRLAIKAASRAARKFPDGTYFVQLEPADSKDYLIPAIARALHFTLDSLINGADLRTQIVDYLGNKSVLLILDGCEFFAGTSSGLSWILEKAPGVRVLAASRQRLGLQAEHILQIEGLKLPENPADAGTEDCESVRLFHERAKMTGADPLHEADPEAVAMICNLVAGMPLGIELAAAWTSILSPREIAQEAARSMDFLSTTLCDIPERHRSLRAVFESSWLLLSDELREAFSKLAVFRGGFTLQAARHAAGVHLEQLLALMDRSLVNRTSDGRFSIHNLLRQYAAEKLREYNELEKEIQENFCQFYVNMVSERETALMGPGMLHARDEIREEMDNIRSAIFWAGAHWPEFEVRKMIPSLAAFYAIHGWQEGVLAFRDLARTRKDALLASGRRDPLQDPAFLCASIHQAFYLCNLGMISESETISRECLEGLHQPGLESELSVCLHNLGVIASFRGEYRDSQNLLEEAIILGREQNHILWPTYLFWLGNLYFQLGEYEHGLLTLQKSHKLFVQQGTLWGTAFALSKIAMAEDGLGNHALAKAHHQQALSEFNRLESRAGKAYALSRMSMSACFLEEYYEAAQLAQLGLEAFSEIGHRWGICTSLCGLGFAHIGLRDMKNAKVFLMEALEKSRPDQMVPQSLFALLGIACCMALEGKEEMAYGIIRYVRRHPETPSIYYKLAARWIDDRNEKTFSPTRNIEIDGPDSLEEIIEQLVN